MIRSWPVINISWKMFAFWFAKERPTMLCNFKLLSVYILVNHYFYNLQKRREDTETPALPIWTDKRLLCLSQNMWGNELLGGSLQSPSADFSSYHRTETKIQEEFCTHPRQTYQKMKLTRIQMISLGVTGIPFTYFNSSPTWISPFAHKHKCTYPQRCQWFIFQIWSGYCAGVWSSDKLNRTSF